MEIKKNYLRNFLHDDIINMGFDEDSIDMAIDAFSESMYDSMPMLITALQNNNYEDIRFHAHTLKGTFANFINEKFQELASLFKKIEDSAKNGEDISSINNDFQQIKNITKEWIEF